MSNRCRGGSHTERQSTGWLWVWVFPHCWRGNVCGTWFGSFADTVAHAVGGYNSPSISSLRTSGNLKKCEWAAARRHHVQEWYRKLLATVTAFRGFRKNVPLWWYTKKISTFSGGPKRAGTALTVLTDISYQYFCNMAEINNQRTRPKTTLQNTSSLADVTSTFAATSVRTPPRKSC